MFKTVIDSQELILNINLREVPEKRVVFQGVWQENPVIVKIFHHQTSAQRHWNRDVDGIQAFEKNNILTPKMLWHGKLPKIEGLNLAGEAWGIILEELTDAVSSLDAWNKSTEDEKAELAESLVITLSDHHKAGLLQTDIHLKNFLISKGGIYSIDGDGLESLEEIPLNKAADNLAFLTVQADPLDQHIFEEKIPSYLTQIKYNQEQFRLEFQKAKESRFNWRCNRWVKKVFRTCSDIEHIKLSGQKIWLNNNFNNDALKAYCENPESLFPQSTGHLLKNGNSATVALVETSGLKLAVKRYNYNKNFRTFIRRFRTSRGAISWGNAHMLMHFGLNTPTPVALMETYNGPAVKHAYYLSLFTEGRDALSWFKDEQIDFEKKKNVAEKFIKIFKTFDICKITHGDLKATNFIINDEDEVFIIDLDAMQKHNSESTFQKARKKDLKRWHKNWNDAPAIQKLFENF